MTTHYGIFWVEPMSESPSKSSSAPSSRDPAPSQHGSHPEIRVAVSSSGSENALRWAWFGTVVLILFGGAILYAARSPVSSTLDRWLPAFVVSAPVPSLEVAQAVALPLPEVEEPAGPQWTLAEIEAAMASLPGDTLALVAEGGSELSQFSGLDSADETQVLLTRNRWRLWGRIWNNRVSQVRRQMPPLPECEIHAESHETCQALARCFVALDRVPEATRLADARSHLADARWWLDARYGPPHRDR